MSRKKKKPRKGKDLYCAAEKNLPLLQEEIAAVLKVSKSTIQNYTRQGMPVIYTGKVQRPSRGSNPRYKYNDCMAWLEKRRSVT